MVDSPDDTSPERFSMKLSMPGFASFVFLSTDDFVCVALSKDLEYLEVRRDSLLTFAETEGIATGFSIMGLLLSVLPGPK